MEAKHSKNDSRWGHTSAAASIQCKLTVGSVNDPLETQADAVADQVMRMPATGLIQRKCSECEEEEELQRKPVTSFIQKKQSDAGGDIASAAVTKKIEATTGGGNAMNSSVKNFMETRFGTDFSDVHIHTDSDAEALSSELHAQAFTVGNDIYFNAGKYSPETSDGKHLLAHELTHTLQQKSNAVSKKAIQRLSATATGTPHNGTCGGFTRSFNFTLDQPAPTDGYMVQKIERYDSEVKCPGMGVCPATPSLTFYEAFFVQAGSTEFYRRQALGMTDQSGHAAKPGTSGARYAHGEIRFFPIAVTGNLGRNNTAGLWSPGNAGGVPASLSLPSTTATPTWWDQHTEGPARRYVNADWRCCGNSNDYNVISANPT